MKLTTAKFRKDSVLSALLQMKKRMAQNGKLRLKKPLKQPSPKGLERSYFLELNPLLDVLLELQNQYLIPALPDLLASFGQNLPKSDDFIDDLERLMNQVKVLFQQRYNPQAIANIVARQALRINDYSKKYFVNNFQHVMGVQPFLSESWLVAESKRFSKENVKLITSIPEQYFDRIETIISQNVRSGALLKDVTAQIQKAFGVTKNRAKLIARDQTSKFNSALNESRQKSVGVKKYVWSSSDDERVRPSHRAFDGAVIEWDNPPSEINGYAWEGHPGQPVNCRCQAIAVFDDDEFSPLK